MRKTLAVASLGLLAFSRGAILPAAPGTLLCPAADSSEAMSAPEPLVAIPCVDGFAGSYPCSNVDLLAVLTLSDMGCGSGNSLWGWTDAIYGKEYALMGCNNGISFVDISTPDSPVYLGRLPTHTSNSLWRDVRVYANYAFIVSEAGGHGMQIFDLTQLRNVPSPPVIFTETAHYNGFGSSHTIAIDEAAGFAYAAGSNTCSGGLHMVNIQDPVNPAGAGCVSSDGYTHETQCVIYNGPDTSYQGHEICFSSNEDTLTIVDVTDKAAPVQISRTGYAGSGYVHQGWLTEDQVYFLLDDELDELDLGHNTYTYIWDVSDLASPVLLGHYTGPTPAIDHNQYIRGSYAYQATYRAGLRILDISGIANASLSQAAFFDIYPDDDAPQFNGAWNNYPFFPSGAVIVSGIEQGLFVLQPHLNPYPTSLSIDDVGVVEGDSGTVSATFTVSLSVASPQTVIVNYATADGTARAGNDYTMTSGLLTFSPGTTSQPVTVLVNGDLLDEADETFFVNLSDPTNATIGDPKGVGMILDDDPVPSLSI
ncbi:MAG: choice-of-anchor B family protein, partial [Thermoanaerobaculia bacterium]